MQTFRHVSPSPAAFRSNKKAASSLTLHVPAKLFVAHSHILFYLYETGIYRYSLIIITITKVKSIVETKIVFIPQILDRTPPIPAPIAKIIIIPQK